MNVGGCLIPLGLALYGLALLSTRDGAMTLPDFAASVITTVVCYLSARPVAGIGIVMPGFIPPVAAVVAALFLAPSNAPPVAFISGVVGALVGADLLHIKDISRVAMSGGGSIGGAGTFDGIILSGIIAAYLA